MMGASIKDTAQLGLMNSMGTTAWQNIVYHSRGG